MLKRLIIFIAITLCVCAESSARMLQDSVLINFRQSKILLDTAYMDNTQALEHARRTIEFYNRPDSNFVLTNVTVVGGASPEGSVKFNEWLSHKRAARIFDYIGARYELPDSLTSFTFLGRDWGGLRRMVLDDPNVPYRADVLSTLDDIIAKYRQGETEDQGNLARIKRLRGGKPYIYMYNRLFPTLRASKVVLTFDNPNIYFSKKIPLPDMPARSGFTPGLPEIRLMRFPAVRQERPFYMDIRTNMLYDALLVPNIGAEFYLGKNLSIVGNWMYAWWDLHPKPYWWRIYGGDLALRWWFGKAAHEKPLTGHHIGIYGSLLTYDFELGGTGIMGGIPRGALWDRCNHFFGVEYGYSLPVAERWNIDFNIGVGYQGGEYQVYDPKDGHYVYRETRYRRFWGPTKAEISLVWLIGRGNYNKKYHKPRLKTGKEAGL